MALDEWLLHQYQQGNSPPVLRFYTWDPVAVSLGFHQHSWAPATPHLGLDMVRRPSGGGAVLHQGDLSYALVSESPTGKRHQDYRYLCRFLIQGWEHLGIPLTYGQGEYTRGANCFARATAADLVHGDQKLIGSAQLRRGRALLQHGSMRLRPDRDLEQAVLGLALPAAPPVPPLPTVESTLVEAARECYGITWVIQGLEAWEWAQIDPGQRFLRGLGEGHH